MSDAVRSAIAVLESGRDLSREQCSAALMEVLSGGVGHDELVRFLRAFAERGETRESLVASAIIMRRHATPIACDDPNAIDTCGTGGDGISTFNVSTAAAIVAAAAGATVAKHGNRSNTRASGSTEVLAALGVDVDAPPPVVERCLREARIGFLNAARLHPAMKHVAAARREVGRRTIFNLLGPLANPANVRRQIIGVPEPALTEKLAAALRELGAVHALVVHGRDGLCDLTITGPTLVAELRDGVISTREITPQDAQLHPGPIDALKVTSPDQSAQRIREILQGAPGPCRDHLLLNAAAALYVAGVAGSLVDGVSIAAVAIDAGRALETLENWARISRGSP